MLTELDAILSQYDIVLPHAEKEIKESREEAIRQLAELRLEQREEAHFQALEERSLFVIKQGTTPSQALHEAQGFLTRKI